MLLRGHVNPGSRAFFAVLEQNAAAAAAAVGAQGRATPPPVLPLRPIAVAIVPRLVAGHMPDRRKPASCRVFALLRAWCGLRPLANADAAVGNGGRTLAITAEQQQSVDMQDGVVLAGRLLRLDVLQDCHGAGREHPRPHPVRRGWHSPIDHGPAVVAGRAVLGPGMEHADSHSANGTPGRKGAEKSHRSWTHAKVCGWPVQSSKKIIRLARVIRCLTTSTGIGGERGDQRGEGARSGRLATAVLLRSVEC